MDDGSKYAGEFKDGLSHGYGTKYAADGTVENKVTGDDDSDDLEMW